MEDLKAQAEEALEALEDEEPELGSSITQQLERVIYALKMRPGREPVLPETLADELKMNILDNMDLLNRLRVNPRVDIIDGKYKFKPEIEFRDCDDLMEHLEREVSGYAESSIRDSYIACKDDVERMRDRGEIIYIKSLERAKFSDVIYRRQFGVFLDLPVTVEPTRGSHTVITNGDLRRDVFRGDLVMIGGEPYRVSRAVRTSSSRVDHSYGSKHKLNNAGGDYTVAAIVPHILGGQSYKYQLPFTATEMSLDRPYTGDTPSSSAARRVQITKAGCSGRLRDLWRAALGETDETSFSFFKSMGRFPDSHELLREAMKRVGLPSTPAPDAMPHTKKFKKSDSKKRARSSVRVHRSNVHLSNTRVGEALNKFREDAVKAQQQRK